jgi:glucose/arabinose dehydrogenase
MRAILALLLLANACAETPSGDNGGNGNGNANGNVNLRLERVTGGLSSPVHLTAPANDSRLFVVEQVGRIRIIRNGQLLTRPFLDIVSRTGSGGERGLLGLAFHPNYATNGFFFVNYTDRNGDTRVERYRVTANADSADGASAQLIITVEQPYSNHNGGLVLFAPDGRLLIGLGDGGSGGDPQGHGQNRGTLLGSILRLDVDGALPYAIPANNPFVNTAGARGEIWAWGLRNPWRFAIDRVDNLIYIADVGQGSWEEINVQSATAGGLNYGWNIMEGRHCYRTASCSMNNLVLPVLEYDHSQGCSVTGGGVYRGAQIPEVRGHYFYADYCAGWIRSFRFSNGQVTQERDWGLDAGSVLSFGEDAAGELYVLSANGTVFRLARE